MATTIPSKKSRADRPGSLYRRTLKLLRDDPRSIEELARLLDLPFSWLYAFSHGEISKPGVHRVQFIYEKLSGKKLTP